jgi:hypothetical protein
LEWEVTADTTEANADFDSGSLTDGFGGDALETWYGFTVTSTPTVNVNTQAVCDNMNQFGQDIMSLLMSATPSFGYGPQAGLAGDVTVGAEDLAFAGIVGLPFGEGAAASYFGLNESFAYEIVDGATSWDPGTSTYPQGSEIPVADVPFAEGFYIGNATSLISWQTE